jgi:Fe-S cluster assembly protein SufD
MTAALDRLVLEAPSVRADDRSARLREAAAAEVRRLGLPTSKDEDWKYTPLRALERTTFERSDPTRRPQPELLDVAVRGSRQVFVDGRFVPELSDDWPAGVEMLPMASEPFLAERYLGQLAEWKGHSFTALNTAIFEDGAILRIAEGARPAEAIHLWFVTTETATPTAVHPRLMVLGGARSELTLVETFVGPHSARGLTNAVAEIWLADSAQLHRVKIQREGPSAFHVARTEARLARDARLVSDAVLLGGTLSHDELGVAFTAPGASCLLRGLFMATGEQHLDQVTRVDHAAERCGSRELYKGVAADTARGVFSGHVLVREGANGTDAHQSSQNVLLSERAIIDARPQLAIYTDDVRCTHGATVGYLDADALFYLRARGVPSGQAQAMLVEGFAAEIVHALPPAALELAGPWFAAKLPPGQEVPA